MTQEVLRGSFKARTNWARNLSYSAAEIVTPGSVEEVQEAVRGANKVRVVGSRHCFNDIADSNGRHIVFDEMRRVVSVDVEHRKATVEGGILYSELGPQLQQHGLALHNLASLPHISVAGAVGTATHGSGPLLGNLSTPVSAIEFVNPEGELVTLERGRDADFPGAVVHLGALGPITKLTLDVLPAFDVRQDVFCQLPIDELVSNFDEITGIGYSVSVFTRWQSDLLEMVWVKSALSPDTPFVPREELFGAVAANCQKHVMDGLDPVHCNEQMGIPAPAHERLPHFRAGFTPASGDELQVEYYVPKKYAPEAVRAVRKIGHLLDDLLLVTEIRTIAEDDLWMSPCYQTPCIALHFSFKSDWPGVRALMPKLEEVLAPFEVRQHWGKLFSMPAEQIQAAYPRLADFKNLIERHDPNGKFRNAFIERTLY